MNLSVRFSNFYLFHRFIPTDKKKERICCRLESENNCSYLVGTLSYCRFMCCRQKVKEIMLLNEAERKMSAVALDSTNKNKIIIIPLYYCEHIKYRKHSFTSKIDYGFLTCYGPWLISFTKCSAKFN